MKLTAYKIYPLSVPLTKPIVTSFGMMTSRQGCLLLLETDDGISGWGESWINYPEWGLQERTATLDAICTRILGSDVSDPKEVNAKLNKYFEVMARQWGAIGPISQAISAVDLAVWDIVAKSQHVPVYKLLGGSINKIRVYGSGIAPDQVVEHLEQAEELGYEAVKIKVGFGHSADLKSIEKARKIWGNRALMLDANQRWTVSEAVKMFRVLEQYQPYWVEEPLLADDLDGLSELSIQSSLSIAVGENIYGKEFGKVMEISSVRYIQPDLAKMGGLSSALEVAELSKDRPVTVVPHVFGTSLSIVVASHFNAVVHSPWLEVDMNENPLRQDLLMGGLTIENGYFHLGESPGWGVELNHEILNRFQVH